MLTGLVSVLRFCSSLIGMKLFYLLYSISIIPCLRMSRDIPLLAMAMKALLLRTKSVALLLLRSVTMTRVPSLLHNFSFLHLTCQMISWVRIRNELQLIAQSITRILTSYGLQCTVKFTAAELKENHLQP